MFMYIVSIHPSLNRNIIIHKDSNMNIAVANDIYIHVYVNMSIHVCYLFNNLFIYLSIYLYRL